MRVADATARRLEARLAEAQVTGRLPSVVVSLGRDGQTVWRSTRGEHVGGAYPDPHDVQYRIGSITKTLTAVLVLRAAHDGRLDLDAPLATVLGEPVGREGALSRATARDLLTHSSGIPSEPQGEWWERSTGVDWSTLVGAHADVGTVGTPGERFHYSNLGYALLGEVVARLEERSWWSAVEQEVLGPLAMDRTSYLPRGPRATGYSVHPWAGTLTEEPATDTGVMAPAGQLWSTTDDLERWARFLLTGDDAVLPGTALRRATHPRSGAVEQGLAQSHGLGPQLYAGGSGVLVGHGGSMPGFMAAVLVDSPRRTTGVVLTNATTGTSPVHLARDLMEELEAAEPTVAPVWRPNPAVPEELQDLLGPWYWGNTAWTFSLEGEQLVGAVRGEVRERFAVVDGRVVGLAGYHAGEELRLVRRDDGSPSHLEVATFVLTRSPYDPRAPVPGGHPEG
jgi:CubicO group peptidase (beta-lactamase class C family)